MGKNKKHASKAGFEFFSPGTPSVSALLDLYSFRIPAGFPSPAEDFKEHTLDLNDYLIRNKSATFLVKVTGTSMEGAGIFDEDVLVVDRAAEVSDGRIVLGVLNGEFTVKRLKINGERVVLLPENSNFNPIEITNDTDFKIWGVVTFCLHKL
ncbi:MAG: translesion error-prone DNA polymerase V autoproteolytic subunit [Bacteroidetes bacterium]|nr:translesion error-prone DNA polymerase V autoproteolytic subunit [Bacteroidota bacterium]